VVDEGTASVLKNPYYKVAAKTGTAQQEGYGGGAGQLYMATMVGYFPADAPKYSCIVAIWTRIGSARDVFYGSTLAGPVFKAVADRVYVTHHEWQRPVSDTLKPATQPPSIKGGPLSSVREVARRLGIKLDADAGRRDWVTTKADSTEVVATVMAADEGRVPQLSGMGLKDALYAVESRGLRADFSGKGRVVAQFPAAGEPVRRGAVITLTLK
jgi:cell division protein FtsI (penicillin-binding protein 3)